MIEPKAHHKREVCVRFGTLQQRLHGGIDCGPVRVDLAHSGARQQAALWAGVLCTHAVVVGIEEVGVARVEGPVTR